MTLIPRSLNMPLDSPPPMLPNAFGDQLSAVTQDPQPLAKMPQLAQDGPVAPKTVYAPDPQQQMIDHDTQALQKVQWKQEHPWGTAENHPGTFGKIAHVLSVAGNIAGNIVAPNVMAGIPGTEANLQVEQGGLAHRLSGEVSEQGKSKEQEAQTGLINETAAAEPQKAEDAHKLSGANAANVESETATRQDALINPLLISGHAHAVDKAIREGRDPGSDPIVQAYEDRMAATQKPSAEKSLMQSQPVIGPDGKPHTYLLDPLTGQKKGDEGVHYEKPITINNNAEHKEKGEVLKIYQPALDSGERFNVMTKNYEDAVKNHDQQAMLSLLANHLGMTMGLQKGARLTKDIINEAKESRPWLQGMGAKFDSDGVLSGVTLTQPQMKQMVDLGRGRFMEDTTKARNEARYIGSNDDGPERTPTKATINHYLGMTNGDIQKAKQLAAQDGWSVK